MIDIALLRKDLSTVIQGLEARKSPQPYLDVERFQLLESERKVLQSKTEDLQAKRNSLSKLVGQLKSKKESADAQMQEVAQMKSELEQCELSLSELQLSLQSLLLSVPNLPDPSVPRGAGLHCEAGATHQRRAGVHHCQLAAHWLAQFQLDPARKRLHWQRLLCAHHAE